MELQDLMKVSSGSRNLTSFQGGLLKQKKKKQDQSPAMVLSQNHLTEEFWLEALQVSFITKLKYIGWIEGTLLDAFSKWSDDFTKEIFLSG